MAQTGFTPILLYSSSTSTNVPLAANLTNSANGAEIAINIADKNLFFKDSGGTVNTIPIRQSSTSSNGWLSSTDWNTFNSKAPATSGTSILYGNGSGGFSNVTIGSGISFAGGTLSATGSGGTVTSVSGTGTVNGLTLTGTVTTSGSLTLGGTLDLSSPPAIGGTTAAAITGTTITANTKFVGTYFDAANSAGGSLRNASGTAQIQWGAGGGSNVTIDVSANLNGTNAQIDISPTGTGHVHMKPTGTGSVEIAPTNVGTMDNMTIGATTPKAITGTTITATTFSGSGASLTSIPNSALTNSTISGVALGGSLFNLTAGTGVSFSAGTTYNGSAAITINATGTGGTVTSVAALTLGTTGTDLSSTVANSTTTPVITLNVPTASATNRGALSAADWTTFNSKQPAGSYLTAVSVVSANGFAGTSSGGTTPALTLSTSITGLLKGNGTAISAATSGTDYAPATSGTSILYGNGAGGFSNVTIGTGLSFTGGTLSSTASSGTVTSVAATVPAFLSISGSPITTSGTLAISYSGTALPVANGGTGLTTLTANYIPFGNGTSAFGSDSSFTWNNSSKYLFVNSTASTGVDTGVQTLTITGVTGGNGGTLGLVSDSLGRNIVLTDSGKAQVATYSISSTISNIGTNSSIPFAFNTVATERMRLDTSGNLLVGTTSQLLSGRVLNVLSSVTAACLATTGATSGQEVLNVWNKATSGNNAFVSFDTESSFTERGTITYNRGAGLVAYNVTSDYRAKTIDGDIKNAINFVKDIKTHMATMKDATVSMPMFVAHELAEIAPYCVTGEKDAIDENGKPKYQQVDSSPLIPLLVKALQELNDKFDAYVASHP